MVADCGTVQTQIYAAFIIVVIHNALFKVKRRKYPLYIEESRNFTIVLIFYQTHEDIKPMEILTSRT